MTSSQRTEPIASGAAGGPRRSGRRPPLALITGGRGRLAHAVTPVFGEIGWEVVAAGHDRLDITRHDEVLSAVRSLRPTAVVNLAAWTDADGCEQDPHHARLVNTRAVRSLADACATVGAHLAHVSSDYVFDGRKAIPYRETDEPRPLSVYGATKLAGEREAGPGATVLRVAWLSGLHGRSLVRTILEQASSGAPLDYVVDQVGSPTVTDGVARALVSLVADRRDGLYHVANEGGASCYELAQHVLASAGFDPEIVRPIATSELRPRRRAPRPGYSVLDTELLRTAGGLRLAPWQDAISELVHHLGIDDLAPVPAVG